jgi:hypothetical protein
MCKVHAKSLLFIGFRSPNSSQNQSLWNARPDSRLGRLDGQLFQCLKSNSEKFSNFGRAVRTLDVSIQTVACLDYSIGRSDHQIVSFFVSFLITPNSSQSDIWLKCYDQNTRGCPDGFTEHPEGQLQPLSKITLKASITRLRSDGVALASRRLHFDCT